MSPPREQRRLVVRLDVDGAVPMIRLQLDADDEVALPPRHAADVVAQVQRRVRAAQDERQSPGAGLYGDLFSGPAKALAEGALAWAEGASERLLEVIFESSSEAVLEWPLELVTSTEHGLLGAQPWCRVLRAPAGGWPETTPPLARDHWGARLAAQLRTWSEEAIDAGHWREGLAFLRSLEEVQRRRGALDGDRSRTWAALARVADWTLGEAAGIHAAEEAGRLGARAGDALLERQGWRILAELLARRGDRIAAERLLDRCIALSVGTGDVATEADDRTYLVQLLFDERRDLDGVRAAPKARRACRRSGRKELEGRLDLALAGGALRHGHERAARNLLARGARRLGRSGYPEAAASAGTKLGYLLLRGRQDDLAAAVFVAALSDALRAVDAGRDAAGVVVEGLLRPLLRDVAPQLLRRRRPDAVAALGLLLLVLASPRPRSCGPVPPPDPLRLLVGWCGRCLRLGGWVAAGGAVVEDGISRVVADRMSRRARKLALALDRLSDGGLSALRLHEEAVAAAHRVVRRPKA